MLFVLCIYLKIIIMSRYLAYWQRFDCNTVHKDFKMQKDKFVIHRGLSKLLKKDFQAVASMMRITGVKREGRTALWPLKRASSHG